MIDIRSRLLTFLKLDREFIQGRGDWLTMNQAGSTNQVLDLAGSFGANLLGHGSPEIKIAAEAFIESDRPAFVQVSRSYKKVELEDAIHRLLIKEGVDTKFSVLLTSTGAETVEVGLKISRLEYEDRKQSIILLLNSSVNLCKWYIENERKQILDSICEELGATSYDHLISIFEQKKELLDEEPFLFHLENSFHGKTQGALTATDNEYYRNPWVDRSKSLSIPVNEDFISKVENYIHLIPYVDHRSNLIRIKKFAFVHGCLIEPIQGESGVRPLDSEWANNLFRWLKKFDISLISDEIQCGLFRCGYLSYAHALSLKPDIYCFGKSLGGGIAKIGLIAFRSSRSIEEISLKHTSTFAGDAFSTTIALQALETLDMNRILIHEAALELDRALNVLVKTYPEFIESVTGIGLMRCIHLNIKRFINNYTTKFFSDIELMGYWLSSVLLNREMIRALPTLSAPNSFRFQPSLHFGREEAEKLIHGFSNLFEAINKWDAQYLFGHISDHIISREQNLVLPSVAHNNPPPKSAFFICHPVDVQHIRQIIGLTRSLSSDYLKINLESFTTLQNYRVYHTDTLKNDKDDEINITFLGIPLISDTFYRNLRSGDRNSLIRQVQEAVDYACNSGATMIGLGQFTSIVTNNGLALSSTAPLTTGNAYTIWLTHKAILNECRKRRFDIEHISIAVVGPCGNILSVLTQMLSEDVAKIYLIHHESIQKSRKYRRVLYSLCEYIISSESDNVFICGMKGVLRRSGFLVNHCVDAVLSQNGVDQFLVVSHELSQAQECDLVVVGTNSTIPIITRDHVKKGSIIIDVSVPRNVSIDIWESSDYTCLSGGMASLPSVGDQIQHLNSVILPFGPGQCFGCMAETFGLSLSGKWSDSNIGDLTTDRVRRVGEVMEEQGFGLHSSKINWTI